MNTMTRCSVVRGSLGQVAPGALARPYIADAAGTTATVWVGQGFVGAPETILPQNAWNDRLVEVSDVVEAQMSRLSETALLASSFYNSVTKQRSLYLAPVEQACAPFHIWGDLVGKAGFDLKDAPRTWDAFRGFFKPMQAALRAKGTGLGSGAGRTGVGPVSCRCHQDDAGCGRGQGVQTCRRDRREVHLRVDWPRRRAPEEPLDTFRVGMDVQIQK
jgi:hypothetical protein